MLKVLLVIMIICDIPSMFVALVIKKYLLFFIYMMIEVAWVILYFYIKRKEGDSKE